MTKKIRFGIFSVPFHFCGKRYVNELKGIGFRKVTKNMKRMQRNIQIIFKNYAKIRKSAEKRFEPDLTHLKINFFVK
jgi:hypothetical protein